MVSRSPVAGPAAGLLLATGLLLSACADPGSDTAVAGGDTSGAAEGTLLVSAAASLTDAFAEIGTRFEDAHLGVEVHLNPGSSSGLREQILEGAPVDVYASANPYNMDLLAGAGELAGDPELFARNLLQIAVPPGNPAGISGLDDFARGELILGLCAEDVPCGEFARQALASAGVEPVIDTAETDVRALLTKIEAGELDAGITYVTDVVSAAGRVDGIDIPGEHNVVAAYPIAVLAGAPNPAAAARFVEYVLGAEGRAILARHGFVTP